MFLQITIGKVENLWLVAPKHNAMHEKISHAYESLIYNIQKWWFSTAIMNNIIISHKSKPLWASYYLLPDLTSTYANEQ